MNEKKVIPVKYFYYGMLTIALTIGGVFFFLWYKEAKEEQLLAEKGCTTKAWVIALYETKTSKRSNPNYYMEVAFFADSSKDENLLDNKKNAVNQTSNNAIITTVAKTTTSLTKPLGSYETQTIPLGSYLQYKRYKIGAIVQVVYLKNNPSIIRLK